MIWAYLIHLGQNFWNDAQGDPSPLGKYAETMVTEDDAWREITDFLPENGVNTLLIDLGEGIQYESHPELACQGAWSKEKLKRELDRLRGIGLTPIPKLNFSAAHDAWLKEYARMVSSPTYYRVTGDLIDEVCELFDTPSLLHVGMDEECFTFLSFQKRYSLSCIRQGDLFWHDVNFFFERCRKNGVRPWIWGDHHWYAAEETIQNLSRDALVSNALYDRMLNPDLFYYFQGPAYEAYFKLSQAGFEQVPTCATYNTAENPDDTVSLLRDLPGVTGFMTAPWFRTRAIDLMKLKADAKVFGAAKEKYFSAE